MGLGELQDQPETESSRSGKGWEEAQKLTKGPRRGPRPEVEKAQKRHEAQKRLQRAQKRPEALEKAQKKPETQKRLEEVQKLRKGSGEVPRPRKGWEEAQETRNPRQGIEKAPSLSQDWEEVQKLEKAQAQKRLGRGAQKAQKSPEALENRSENPKTSLDLASKITKLVLDKAKLKTPRHRVTSKRWEEKFGKAPGNLTKRKNRLVIG